MTAITIEVDDATLAALDEMAGAKGISREQVVADIGSHYAKQELALREFVQVGIDAAERGDFIEQDEMRRWLRARYEERSAAE